MKQRTLTLCFENSNQVIFDMYGEDDDDYWVPPGAILTNGVLFVQSDHDNTLYNQVVYFANLDKAERLKN